MDVSSRKNLIDKALFMITENISGLVGGFRERRDIYQHSSIDEISFQLQLIKKIVISNCFYSEKQMQEMRREQKESYERQKEYDELNSPSAMADYFGLDIDKIAQDLLKNPNEISNDDINNYVGN